MNSYYFEVAIQTRSEQIDPLCALLTAMGSTGVTVEERVLDTFTAPSADTPDVDGVIKAYFEDDWDAKALSEQVGSICSQVGAGSDVQVRKLATADWAESWKQHFPPIRIGESLLILPTWEEVPKGAPAHVLRLDPGMAFGTGTHETTALCLEQMVGAIETGDVTSVLDVGTGSGILAMAAAILKVTTVVGCDIDAGACEVARDNCTANGLPQVMITDDPLEELAEGFDLVVANILAEENVRLAAELCRRVNPGGWLILSGILTEKEALVQEGFACFDIGEPTIVRQKDWSCLVYRVSQE